MQRTSLYTAHVSAGGRLVDFAGWEMPVQYTGPVPEHMAVREAAGLFDVSHMGEIEITGTGALALVQRLTTNDVSKLADNQVQYSMLTNESAGVIDDLLVYKKAIRKSLDAYTQTTPPHVKAARKLGSRAGRIIAYVMTSAGPEPAGETTAAPDYEHYIEHQIRPVADAVLRFLGLEFEDIAGTQRQLRLF